MFALSGVDRLGNTYYYNKYTMRVINSHPLSELFIDWIAASRQRLADETELRRKDALEDEEIEEDMGTPVRPVLPFKTHICAIS
jgi:hypothetical protein